jgi:hypothetical protein
MSSSCRRAGPAVGAACRLVLGLWVDHPENPNRSTLIRSVGTPAAATSWVAASQKAVDPQT